MNIIYVGLDVDDNQYHGSALNKQTGEVITFQCRPTLSGLLKQLAKLANAYPDSSLGLCYEASYIGYTLHRDLVKHGYHSDVVAPSSILSPRGRGRQIKTDRIDAAQLAQFYANGLLTSVSIPEPEQEQDRDLLRSRQKLVNQRKQLRTHILSLLRRNGRHYRQETPNKSHWTMPHY
jgi:transposase